MTGARFQSLPGDITCIDADYVQPGIACFYLVGDGDEYALVETGTSHSYDNLRRTLAALSIEPGQIRYVIPTHVHLDHAGGAGRYMRAFPQATLLVHPRGARHLIDPERLIASAQQVYGEEAFRALYGTIDPVPAERVRELADGERVAIGDRELLVQHTRGHAEHHLCLWDERTRGWFSGDMFGISYDYLRLPGGSFVLPATTPTQFDPEAYAESVATLAARAPRYMYLTHYGRLPFEGRQVDLLHDQLREYARLGDACAGDTAQLQAAVTEYTRERLAPLAGAEQARTLGERLEMDLALNVQGIAFRAARAKVPSPDTPAS
ncbi:MBL fold metallo-hydrolase [Parahaliea mediterranea]|uniref:MBL fold metallo-hydrolase n=1 Tax=Parahaliea mediterranea TaxID=651086 RepID=A0A939ILF3_9GAMM|nr:MBL fold metallo-hydrolase [Parahaliea mediterranea]